MTDRRTQKERLEQIRVLFGHVLQQNNLIDSDIAHVVVDSKRGNLRCKVEIKHDLLGKLGAEGQAALERVMD